MRKLLIGAMLLAFLLPCHAMAQSAFDGTWKIDVSKVQASNKPKIMTLKNGEYTCNCAPPLRVMADGADHAVSGHPRVDVVSIKVVNDHTITETGKKDGTLVYSTTTTVAANGKTASFESSNAHPGGTSTVKGSMKRLAKGSTGSHAIAGAWQITGYQAASDNMLSYTYTIAGDSISMSNPRGESYTAKLDGQPVDFKGDLGTDKVAVTMVGKALQETTSLAGTVNAVSKITVSSDGKTMKTVTTNKPSERVVIVVAAKQ